MWRVEAATAGGLIEPPNYSNGTICETTAACSSREGASCGNGYILRTTGDNDVRTMLHRSIELWSQSTELSPDAPVRLLDLPAASSSAPPRRSHDGPEARLRGHLLHRRDSAEPCTRRGPYVHGWWTGLSRTVVFILMNHCKDSSMRPVPTLLALSCSLPAPRSPMPPTPPKATTVLPCAGCDEYRLGQHAPRQHQRGRQDIGFSEDFKLGGKEWEPRIDGMFRISNRQRLLFNYFKYDKDRRETLGGTSPSVTSACRPAASSRAS